MKVQSLGDDFRPPMQGRKLAGRQDTSEGPGTSKFEDDGIQTRRIAQQDF